ncbi:MAG: hypothetical protein WBD05_00905 [Phycisphaerae bacterium]
MNSALLNPSPDGACALSLEIVVWGRSICRTPSAHGTGLPVYHPMELLAEGLGEKTGEVVRPVG